jgi:DNA-binding NarL/FixJ family response regulator
VPTRTPAAAAAPAARTNVQLAVKRPLVARVLAKLGLRDRTQAVVAAYEARLVRRGEG